MKVEMKAEIYVDASGQYRWRLRADNGEIIAASTEGYKEERDARANLERLIKIRWGVDDG